MVTGAENRLLAALSETDQVALLSDLVSVPSAVGEEGPLAVRIASKLQEFGFDVELQTVKGARKNVIGQYRFSSPGPHLMFNGHLDTVPVSGPWSTDPHVATIKEDRLYGLGALDMKGGIAAALTVCAAAVASKAFRAGTLSFSGVIDEEAYSDGARALLERGLDDVDAIVIGEPFSGQKDNPIPVLTPGKVLYRLTTRGRAAHGFLPREGVNAVEDASRIVAALDRLHQDEHPTLGRGPVSTLKMHGGYEQYSVVVPAYCEVVVSRMIVPGETREQCRKDMENLISELGLESQVTVELVPPYYAPMEIDPSSHLFEAFADAFRAETGERPVYAPFPTITDASVFYGSGRIPTLLFGPAGGGFHQVDEFVDLRSLTSCARTYARLAARVLGTQFKSGKAH